MIPPPLKNEAQDQFGLRPVLVKAVGALALFATGVVIAFALYQSWLGVPYNWGASGPYDSLVGAVIGGLSAALLIAWILYSLGKLNFRFSSRILISISIIWVGFGAGLFGPAALGRDGPWVVPPLQPPGTYWEYPDSLELYLGNKSVTAGDLVSVFASSPNDQYSLEIVRFGETEQVVFQGDKRAPKTQRTNDLAFGYGAGWEETDQLPTVGLEPGVYSVRGHGNGGSFESIFCLRPPVGEEEALTLLLNTNTWAAYNSWGGASLYRWNLPFDHQRPHASWASFLRPNPGERSASDSSHLFGGELHLIRWLEANEIPYSCATDSDLHDDSRIFANSKTLVLNTHPEYWSAAMYDNLEGFLNAGGSLLNLGGNVLYWKTNLFESGIFVDKTRQVEGQGLWREVGRPESSILGVRYDASGYNTYAPYEVLIEDHWVFKGLGLRSGDTFGEESLVTAIEGESGASGWETDKTDEFSPANGLVLAKGTNPEGGAELFFYEHPGGGKVLSFGSLTSASSVPIDKKMAGIVVNFFTRVGVVAPLSE